MSGLMTIDFWIDTVGHVVKLFEEIDGHEGYDVGGGALNFVVSLTIINSKGKKKSIIEAPVQRSAL